MTARAQRIRSAGGTLAWLAGYALVLGTWVALRRDLREGQPLATRKRRSVLHTLIALILRLEPVQARVDHVSGLPNVGLLVSALSAPLAIARTLHVYDDLMDAPRNRRRWHEVYPIVMAAAEGVCWLKGVPHDRRVCWTFSGVSVDDDNRWRDAFALLSMATLAEQSVEGTLASQRIVLHLYATGHARALCVRSALYSLSWACTAAVTLGLSLRPAVHLITGRDRFHIPLAVQQVLLFVSFAGQLFGALATRLSLGAAGGPARTAAERWIERVLRAMLVIACYRPMRRLAFSMQDTLPLPRPRIRYGQTSLGRIHRLGELELLLQMFKTTINDARLSLVGYVDMDLVPVPEDPPERAAAALACAIANYARGLMPVTAAAADNPLRDAASFNDDRFLAAVWPAYQRYLHAPERCPSSARLHERAHMPGTFG